MHRFTAIRNVIAVITMTVAALCGGGKAMAAQNSIFSTVEVRNGDTLRQDRDKGQTPPDPASVETAIASDNVAVSEKGVFEAPYAPRAKISFSFQDQKALLFAGEVTAQFRKLGAFIRPPTRAPPQISGTD